MNRGLLVCVMWLGACGGDRDRARTRSPTVDYPLPPTRTSFEGEGLGADRQRPEDKLEQGPRIGPGGPRPAAEHPYATEERDRHDAPPPAPCREVGLRDAEGQSRCPEARPKKESPVR